MERLKELIKKFGGKEELETEITKELERSYIPISKIQEEKEKKEHEESEQRIKEIGEIIKEALKQTGSQEKEQEETNPPKAETSSNQQEVLQRSLEELQKKYDELQAYNEQLQNNRKESLLDAEIVKAGGRNPKAIKALLDMGKIVVKEDGTLEGLDLEGLKKTDSYLFNAETQSIEGTGFTKGDTATIKPEEMNYTQLCKYLENNPSAKIE